MAAVLPASASNVTSVKTPVMSKPTKQAQPVRKVRWVIDFYLEPKSAAAASQIRQRGSHFWPSKDWVGREINNGIKGNKTKGGGGGRRIWVKRVSAYNYYSEKKLWLDFSVSPLCLWSIVGLYCFGRMLQNAFERETKESFSRQV